MSKQAKIYVGTPCYGDQCFTGYLVSILHTANYLKERNLPITIQNSFLGSESLITRGRNTITARFLNDSSFTHLLFIDADITWHPSTIEKLVNADVDVVGAIYPKKSYKWKNLSKILPELMKCKTIDDNVESFIKANLLEYVVNYGEGNSGQIVNNLIEVKYIGTGFMLIKREVLEKMCKKFPECKYDDDIGILTKDENEHLYSLFDCEISVESDGKSRYLSEDYLFCKRWLDMGGKIYAEVTSILTHSGTHNFRGNYLASLRFGPNAESVLTNPLIEQTHPVDILIPKSVSNKKIVKKYNYSLIWPIAFLIICIAYFLK